MFLGIRKPLAFVVRDFGDAASYKLSFLMQFAGIFFSILTFFFLSRLFGGVVVSYLQVGRAERRLVLAHTARALAPGGELFMIGHALRNLMEGVGGPQDPLVLWDPDEISEAFDRAVRRACPGSVKVAITTHGTCGAYLAELDSPGMQAARDALAAGYGQAPVLTSEGGTLPILVRHFTSRTHVGRGVAWLYFLNSAGAAIGCNPQKKEEDCFERGAAH